MRLYSTNAAKEDYTPNGVMVQAEGDHDTSAERSQWDRW